MKGSSLVVQKFVYKGIFKKVSIFKVDINKKLMGHVKRSHRYNTITDEERKKAQTEGEKKREERKRLSNEIRDLQEAKKKEAIFFYKIIFK